MYAYIDGIIEDIGIDRVVLENHGIGYEIMLTSSDLANISVQQETVRLYTYFHAGENGVFLYGFLKKEEKDLFLKLITVSGIGPKGALSILGTLSALEVQMAIISEDEKLIAKSPGIGAKTAKRVILELKDKISSQSVDALLDTSEQSSFTGSSTVNEAIQALVSLGFSYAQASDAVRLVSKDSDINVETVIKEALKQLG